MIIRTAREDDVNEVVELIYLAIQDIAYQLTGEQEKYAALEQLKRFFVQEGNRFSSSLVTVVEVEKRIVAMMICYDGADAKRLYHPIKEHLKKKTNSTSPIIDVEADEDEYYIDAIAVSAEEQGKGLAKALFIVAEQQAKEKGLGKIALNVELNNERAHELYKKQGYVADKQIKINNHLFRHMAKLI